MNMTNATQQQETQPTNFSDNSPPKIAVRLYENQKLGKSFAPAKFHVSLFNATADLVSPHHKYLMDYVSLSNWIKSARNDDQREACDHVLEMIASKGLDKDQLLASWIKRYDQPNSKIMIPGFSTFDLSGSLLEMCIVDEAVGVQSFWKLDVRVCRVKYGQKSPQLLAANYDLV